MGGGGRHVSGRPFGPKQAAHLRWWWLSGLELQFGGGWSSGGTGGDEYCVGMCPGVKKSKLELVSEDEDRAVPEEL